MRRVREHGPMRLSAAGTALFAALALRSLPAHAEEKDPRAAAKAAYDRGAAAHDRGDHATAARAFARADELAPDPVALRVALEEAVLADDPALGLSLSDRATRWPMNEELKEAAGVARRVFAGRAGRLRVRCTGCTVTLDGEPLEVDRDRFVRVGKHEVIARAGEQVERRSIDVGPGARVALEVQLIPRSLSPAWFFVGLGATTLAGVGVLVSGLDAAHQHDRFVDAGCPGPTHGAGCAALGDAGFAAQTRTNAFIGVTAALGATTAVLGYLAFRPGGAGLAIETRAGGPLAKLIVPLP